MRIKGYIIVRLTDSCRNVWNKLMFSKPQLVECYCMTELRIMESPVVRDYTHLLH